MTSRRLPWLLFSYGAITISALSRPTIINSLIARNSAGTIGGAVSIFTGSAPEFINCTIADNFAAEKGGAVFCNDGSRPSFVNTVLWSNSAPLGPQVYVSSFFQSSTVPSLTYCAVKGGLEEVFVEEGSSIEWGPGNLDLDPLFANPDHGDYRLLTGSPCIDAADNTAVPDDVTTDLNGNPRFIDEPATPDSGNPDGINPIVDMGAYEFNCVDDDGDGKVTICHNGHTISVSTNAVSAHLRHGDECGVCD